MAHDPHSELFLPVDPSTLPALRRALNISAADVQAAMDIPLSGGQPRRVQAFEAWAQDRDLLRRYREHVLAAAGREDEHATLLPATRLSTGDTQGMVAHALQIAPAVIAEIEAMVYDTAFCAAYLRALTELAPRVAAVRSSILLREAPLARTA